MGDTKIKSSPRYQFTRKLLMIKGLVPFCGIVIDAFRKREFVIPSALKSTNDRWLAWPSHYG
jgi:hypothetical protein